MVVCFQYLVKSDLSSVRVYSTLHWKSQFLQGTRKKHGHVYLVRLYIKFKIKTIALSCNQLSRSVQVKGKIELKAESIDIAFYFFFQNFFKSACIFRDPLSGPYKLIDFSSIL